MLLQMLHAGTAADPQDVFMANCGHGRDALPLHEHSAWDSFRPQMAWSASASSLVTTSGLSSKILCDTHTHSGDSLASGHSVMPAHKDTVNVTCLPYDKQHDKGKGSKISRFLHWLTDPDSRDVRRSKKTGLPVEKGPLHTLANATGQSSV